MYTFKNNIYILQLPCGWVGCGLYYISIASVPGEWVPIKFPGQLSYSLSHYSYYSSYSYYSYYINLLSSNEKLYDPMFVQTSLKTKFVFLLIYHPPIH